MEPAHWKGPHLVLDAGATVYNSHEAQIVTLYVLIVSVLPVVINCLLHVCNSPQNPTNKRGLDSSVLRSLPITVYRTEDFEEGLECAICLSELDDGEKARVLRKCGHGFHLECIDMWFNSHSTCPLCRCIISAEPSSDRNPAAEATDPTPPPETSPESAVANGASALEGPSTPSSRVKKAEAALVIEILRSESEGFPSPRSPLPRRSRRSRRG